MALIDEYKQAIQDVLDGRAKPAPRPSELPWSEDKAATMWAAAAAELIAEAAIPEPEPELPATPGSNGTYTLQNTVSSGTGTMSWASGGSSGGGVLVVNLTDDTTQIVADKTAGEIYEAYLSGKAIIAHSVEPLADPYVQDNYFTVTVVAYIENVAEQAYGFIMDRDDNIYYADTANDYPTFYWG